MTKPEFDNDADQSLRDAFQLAYELPVEPPASGREVWAAGTARIRRRRYRRISITAVATFALVAVSIPAIKSLNDGSRRTQSEITMADANQGGPADSPSWINPAASGGRSTISGIESPAGTANATDASPESIAPSSSSRTPQNIPAPTSTVRSPTTTTSSGVNDGSTSIEDGGSRTPPTIENPSGALTVAARAAFGSNFGGITGGIDGTLVVHVKPGRNPLPATFQGHAVVAAEFSWNELEEIVARIKSQEPALIARGVPFIDCVLDYELQIMVSVASISPNIQAAAQDVLGIGPWYLASGIATPGIG